MCKCLFVSLPTTLTPRCSSSKIINNETIADRLGKYDQTFALQAEEITLTIGQAFDLAYKKFLESGGKDVETRKQIGSLQKRVCFPFLHTCHRHGNTIVHAELVSAACFSFSSVDRN